MKKLLTLIAILISANAFAQSAQRDQIKLTLQNVLVNDTAMQMEFMIENKSAVVYRPAFIEYILQDKKISKRTAQQESMLKPTEAATIHLLKGNTSKHFTVRFPPFMIPRGQVMIVRTAEDNGARAIALKIKGKRLLKAKILKDGNDATDTGPE